MASREEVIAQGVINQINSFRQQRGLFPFRVSDLLSKAASTQSYDMVIHNFFDHVSPVPGRTRPHDRAVAFGYPSSMIAENLFMSMGSTDDAIIVQCFQTWAQSSGHLTNMMDTLRTEIGVGVATNSSGETYITAMFGRP
jgi:uncharacterized protein YkwD